MGADGAGSVGAVNAIHRAAEIHGTCAKRVAGAAGHEARQVRLTRDHFHWWRPVRPLGLLGDRLRAGPSEAVAADADAIADRLTAAEHIIEIGIGRIDDDSTGQLAGRVAHDLALQPRRHFDYG